MRIFSKISILPQLFFVALVSMPVVSNAQGLQSFSKPKVVEPCNVYWNGREFKKGSTQGDANFSRLSYSFYGVESVIVSVPNGMAKEFGIDTADTGKEFIPSKKFETFITNQWNDITRLCKLEKLK